jgi:hypothetical protein
LNAIVGRKDIDHYDMDTTDPDNRKRSLAETGQGKKTGPQQVVPQAKEPPTFEVGYFQAVMQSAPEWLRGEINVHATEKRRNQAMYAFMSHFASLIKNAEKRNQILAAPPKDHLSLMHEALVEMFATQHGTRNPTRNSYDRAKAHVDELMQVKYDFPRWNDN